MSDTFFSRILSGLGGKGRKNASVETSKVDISRVIPGFVSADEVASTEVHTDDASDQAAAPAPQEAEAPVLLEDTVIQDGQASEAEHNIDLAVPPEERAENALEELSDKYDDWLSKDLERLNDAWQAARLGEYQDADISALQLAAHDLRGMGDTYGHPAISRLAASLSLLIKDGFRVESAALVNLHVEACRAAFLEGRATESGNAMADSVCAALEVQVKRTLEA